ncbi:hypothetical protein [Idiomarina sp.]|uniref:hypothetical protein n=1 Tax=Idiomarina sp. TaxID=1874361 RepID=UPI0025B8FDAD|nr:hypothetical protein [Idiomarina sp.]
MKKLDIKESLRIKVFNEKLRRNLRRKKLLRVKQKGTLNKSVLKDRMIELSLLTAITSLNPSRSLRSQKKLAVKIPKVFSLFHCTDEVLELITRTAYLHRSKRLKEIEIDHSDCEENDLAAEVLLSGIIKALRSNRKKSGKTARAHGYLSAENEFINRLIKSIGLVRELARKRHKLENLKENRISLFRADSLIHEKPNQKKPMEVDRKNRATSRLANHLNKSINSIDKKLKEDSISFLIEYIGELIDNAEEHSGKNIWRCYGYLDSIKTAGGMLKSEIVVLNYGKSIYETFIEKSGSPSVWKFIDQYLQGLNETRDNKTLVTIAALRKFISSKKDESTTRGRGTWSVIETFHRISKAWQAELGGTQTDYIPEMIIVSGEVAVRFTPELIIKSIESIDYSSDKHASEKYVVAFNETNDPLKKPDKRFVYSLKYPFPGTIVSIKFPVATTLTEAVTHD